MPDFIASEQLIPARRVGERRAGFRGVVCFLALVGAVWCPVLAGATPAETMLADAFTRRAMSLLQGAEPEDTARQDAASVLLEFATELDPADAERHRLRAELAKRLGDVDAHKQSLGRYVALQPSDDVAMLELLLLRLENTQTLDGRLSAIEGVLNTSKKNKRVSKPLRSRLAWIAAEAAQELGDRRRYVRWVTQAAKLDPANALAAETTYALIAEMDSGPKPLGAAAKNWVEASPVDPRARLALAEVLAGQAAYLDAAQQFANAARFSRDAPLSWPAYRAWVLCVGASGDKLAALELLASLENLVQTGVFGEGAVAQGLPVELELLRLTLMGAASVQGAGNHDPDAVAAVYERVVLGLEDRHAQGDADAALELAWVKAVFGPEPQEVAALLEEADPDDARRRRAAGWAYQRQGQDDAAMEMFSAAPGDPLAKLGRAMIAQSDGPLRQQIQREIIRESPLSLAALITVQMHHRNNRPVEPTAEGVAILDLMQRTDHKVWRMDLDRDPWIELQARVRPLTATPYTPVTLELSIRNGSTIPLALGPGQPLGLTTLLNVGLFAGGQPVGALPTQVVDGNRRLTLQPGERITVVYRLDWNVLGRVAAQDLEKSFAYALSATLDPRVRPDGAMTVGPLGTVDTVRGLQSSGAMFDDTSITQWLEDVSRPQAQAGVRAAALLTRAANRSAGGMQTRTRIAEALNTLATQGGAPELAWGVYHLAPAADGSDFQRLLDAARRSDDELVRIAHLIGQADRADHPALDAAARTSLPRLRRFSQAWREVLEQQSDVSPVELTRPPQP